ncbi:MAG: hypothetical protein HC929_18040 [Leptolyngbyaceae cyanobacterium SM2_5_2]|nr:hypothetical protein [Leptolyngbyaceae cyanobacterium SM2_5_2]
MMYLFSRTLGLGLLTTLAGALGLALPVHALPNADGNAADLIHQSAPDPSHPAAESAPPSEGLTETANAHPDAALGDTATEAAADNLETAESTPADGTETDSAEGWALPLDMPPAVSTGDVELAPLSGDEDGLANRRENTELFESEPGQHQVPLNPPPTDPLRPVTPLDEVAEYVLTLAPEREIQIPANGRSSLTLIGDITTADGQPITEDVVVTLSTTAGEFIGADYDTDQAGFQVLARQGQFEAQLRSGLNAQSVIVQAVADGREVRGLDPATTREFYPVLVDSAEVSFFTDLRPTLISGVVDFRIGRGGTNLLGSFRDFLSPTELNRDVAVDLQAGIFGTGSIGEWLFTGAYNSSRGLNDRCDGSSLYRDVQFCEQTYAVYGDSSTTDFMTPSIDSFYLRFQRDSIVPGAGPDYFMWGDYGTEEFAAVSQDFTATVRELHGFKGNFTFGNGIQITALYGDNVRPFQRDTIAPDGTSGYYFLSRRLVLRGSENVFIETEELNRPGTVLEREPLYRGVDYEIDYDRGTLIFRKPLLRTDLSDTGEVLVRRIVVTYQFEEQSSGNTLYAGRLRYHLDRTQNQETWLGATYLRENLGVRSFELYGADALITFGPRQQVVAEFARANNESEAVGLVTGSAYRIEATASFGNWLDTRAYLRSASTGFANNATISFVPGQLRYGAEASTRISENTRLRVQYDFERNDGIAPRPLATFEDVINPGVDPTPGSRVDNSLTTVSLGVQQKLGQSELTMDWLYRSREDRINPNTLSGDANQLRTRFRMPLGERLSFIAQNELSLSSNPDTVFPDRTVLGINWEALPGINFRLAQQSAIFAVPSILRIFRCTWAILSIFSLLPLSPNQNSQNMLTE